MIRARHLGIAMLPLAIACGAQAASHKIVHHVRRHVHATGIGVSVDEARLISFDRPVKTVFLGNPSIADISVLDARHAFILGKTMGLTNLIALDMNGAQIENKQVVVTNTFAATTLNRGPDQFSYTCTSARCETAPRPGDDKTFVEETDRVVQSHAQMGSQAATAVAAQSPAPAD